MGLSAAGDLLAKSLVRVQKYEEDCSRKYETVRAFVRLLVAVRSM
jgi:hypothetical protein